MDNYSLPLEKWAEVFKEFRQVQHVQTFFSEEILKITIEGFKEKLLFNLDDLDDTLYEFKGNPREVAASFLKKNGVLIVYDDTLVGFFDIQGYSSFIGENPVIEECIQKITRLFSLTKSVADTDIASVKFNHWILSDSIIVVVDTNRSPLFGGSIEAFLLTCKAIMEAGMMEKILLRGAIGGGYFYKDGEIMVSNALVDAARYEEAQNWLKAVITPNAFRLIEKAKETDIKENRKIISDLTGGSFNEFILYGKIPWKEKAKLDTRIETPDEMFYINPRSPYRDPKNCIPDYFNDDKKLANSDLI